MQKRFNLKFSYIKNQQRFPISKFGWPLKEASEIILKGQGGWQKEAIEIIERHVNKRRKMVSLSEIYDLDCLKKWDINCAFIPWFSQKPIFNKRIFDHDYLNVEGGIIVGKLCKLIKSIENNGFKESELIVKNIIVYPLDEEKNCFYVRAGNHRVAVLSAMKEKIPCYLDNISFLKSRDKLLISKYIFKFNTGKINQNYPHVDLIQNWPSVKQGILKKDDAIHIKKIFCA
tara:strand:+ start:5873 stop:6562 length:690 start_codon:yes stop_codon:yes gene_type:complete